MSPRTSLFSTILIPVFLVTFIQPSYALSEQNQPVPTLVETPTQASLPVEKEAKPQVLFQQDCSITIHKQMGAIETITTKNAVVASQNEIALLEEIKAFTEEKKAEIIQKKRCIERDTEKNTFFFFVPRPRFLKEKCTDFYAWFMKKDAAYTDGSKRSEMRQEWETLLGVDVFHPYFKFKEARKKMKEKVTMEVYGFKIEPDYRDKKIWLTFTKKF